MSTIEAIQAHYEHYPYPTVAQLQFRDPIDHLRGTLNYLLRRRPTNAIKRDARIWVAGCGTEQAVSWARRFPAGQVLGTDLAQQSLTVSRQLAEQLGVRNLTLEQADLLEFSPAEPFDLVICTGVLHHLPDPSAGLAKIAKVLSADGAALLMVYSRAHRGALQSFRAALDVVAPADQPGDARYASATKLLDALLDGGRCVPACPQVFEELRSQSHDDPAFVADALMNPLEHCFDIDELFDWVQNAGLRHSSWYRPAAWNIGAYLEDAELVAQIEDAPPRDQWRAIYHLAGLAGPMLDFLVEPQAQAEPAPYNQDEFLNFKPMWLNQMIGYQIEAGRIVAEGRGPAFEQRDDIIAGRALPSSGMNYSWQLPEATQAILAACNGERTVAELQQLLENDFAPEDVVSLIVQFMPDQLGLMVPVMG